MNSNPYTPPPFDPGNQRPRIEYKWWSWHPNYPYWSESCWGGETETEAWDSIAGPHAHSLTLYHNKLIRQGDGNYVEVADVPCQRPEVWAQIKVQRAARKKELEAKLAVLRKQPQAISISTEIACVAAELAGLQYP